MIEIKGETEDRFGRIAGIILLIFVVVMSLSVDLLFVKNITCFTFLALFCAYAVLVLAKKREIIIDDDKIAIRIFKKREFGHGDIKRIQTQILVEPRSWQGGKAGTSIMHITIRPGRHLFGYWLSGEHFTKDQMMEIYCALKRLIGINEEVWTYILSIRGGKHYDKLWIRTVKSNDLEEYCWLMEHIKTLCEENIDEESVKVSNCDTDEKEEARPKSRV